MLREVRYRGRTYTEEEVDEIRNLIAQNPEASRFLLSKEICRRWNWVQANGIPKDMLCRGLLLMLDREGLITLPPRKQAPTCHLRREWRPVPIAVDVSPIICAVSNVMPVTITMVRRTPHERLYKSLIHEYHYLGYTSPVGEHLEYVAFSEGRPVACIGFCSAPRHIGVRDRYFEWNREARIANLHKIAVNTRFLILPWVRVLHLASHLLSQMAKRISHDWKALYHHEIVWIETFVDPARGFAGTCYKAANWKYIGLTTGRGKNDNTRKPNRSLKYVFGYPLIKDFRRELHGVL